MFLENRLIIGSGTEFRYRKKEEPKILTAEEIRKKAYLERYGAQNDNK